MDLKLGSLGAHTLAGRPLAELAGACVPFDEIFGAPGAELVARLREAGDWDPRFDRLEGFLLGRLAAGPAPTPASAGHGGACSRPTA